MGQGTLGTILLGDMNVHEESWLQHSNGSSVEGRALRDFACSYGLEERVRQADAGVDLLGPAVQPLAVRAAGPERCKCKIYPLGTARV